MRISAWSSDVCSSDLDHVRLVYFGRTSGLARKLFPLGEARRVSGRLDLYGDMRQIVHPDHVAEPGDEGAIAIHEPVYPLTEGLTNARLSQLAAVALDRRPELPELIDAPLLPPRHWPAGPAAMEAREARKSAGEGSSVQVTVTLESGRSN